MVQEETVVEAEAEGGDGAEVEVGAEVGLEARGVEDPVSLEGVRGKGERDMMRKKRWCTWGLGQRPSLRSFFSR